MLSAARPIVVLPRRPDSTLSRWISPDTRYVGAFLPYTPLHHLLLAEVGGPLVMTSGNLSEEPIAMDNAEALERLGRIADAFLLHDRPIHSRYDDSVFRVVEGAVEPVRRARGYAPFPLSLPFESDIDILAVGPEQKNTFTLLTGSYAFVSQHIGDMENAETLASFEQTIELYERLFRIEPELAEPDPVLRDGDVPLRGCTWFEYESLVRGVQFLSEEVRHARDQARAHGLRQYAAHLDRDCVAPRRLFARDYLEADPLVQRDLRPDAHLDETDPRIRAVMVNDDLSELDRESNDTVVLAAEVKPL
jgi:hypothetical protein